MRGFSRLGELCEDVLQDSGPALQHIIVPVARNLKTFDSQFRVSRGISFRTGVLTTINFNDKTLFEADKVENVTLKGDLSAEFDVI